MNKKVKHVFSHLKDYVAKNKIALIILLILFFIHIFFRFYQLEERAQFTWDQVDNAWHAKNLIVNHIFPVTGMPAKQSSSMSIGPLYYYFVTAFYYITNLDPIVSPIIAGLTSVFSFFVIFFVTSKLFNKYIALIAISINTFSFYLILQDRIQWPVNFIAPIGLLIFYSLYQIVKGKNNFFILLFILLGISFHIHFTFVFYIVITLLMIPFFKRTKAAFIYTTIGLTFFVVLTVPFLLLSKQSSVGLNFIAFFNQNSVGFHLRRFLQVADTAFLESILIIGSQMTGFLKYFLLPVFIALYVLTENKKPFLKINTKKIYTGLFVRKNWPQFKKRKITFLYLLTLWYVVPWVALSMYQGELTPYYFALTRYVSLCLMAYILYTFIRWKRAIFVPLALVVGALFFMWNTGQFLNYKTEGLKDLKKHAYDDFKHSRGNIFTYGAAETYLYYFYEYRAYGKK